MIMNKLIRLTIFAFIPLLITGCKPKPNGGSITFTADLIGDTPIEEEKTFTYKGHTFIYYNVYNDGNGNFVMANNDSYIANNDIQFGLRVKSAYVYTVPEDGGEPVWIEPSVHNKNGGYYDYAIQVFGFQIRGIGLNISMNYTDINIGTITHWC